MLSAPDVQVTNQKDKDEQLLPAAPAQRGRAPVPWEAVVRESWGGRLSDRIEVVRLAVEAGDFDKGIEGQHGRPNTRARLSEVGPIRKLPQAPEEALVVARR